MISDTIVVQVIEVSLTIGTEIYPPLNFPIIGKCVIRVIPVVEFLIVLNELGSVL